MAEINKGYAMALFSLCDEENCTEITYNELLMLKKIFEENSEYTQIISSPLISKKERIQLLTKMLGSNFSNYTSSVVLLLCENNQIQGFFECVDEYEKLYSQKIKLSCASVISAFELSDEEKEKIRSKLEAQTGGSVMLDCSVDKSLLGGITVEIGGKVYDGSLKRRLREIKKVIDE
ncbi:MAG: F0F1 ATP synthase subunit delta [Clostridia bacterium]|nr:F0F1 ATP synthase subunit delta [Clostridia bacterium]